MFTLQKMEDWLAREASNAVSRIDAWRMQFQDDPAYSLEWGDEVYRYAATLKVCKQCLAIIQADTENGVDDKQIVQNFMQYLLEKVTGNALLDACSHSSSATSNIMHSAILNFYGEVYRLFHHYMQRQA